MLNPLVLRNDLFLFCACSSGGGGVVGGGCQVVCECTSYLLQWLWIHSTNMPSPLLSVLCSPLPTPPASLSLLFFFLPCPPMPFPCLTYPRTAFPLSFASAMQFVEELALLHWESFIRLAYKIWQLNNSHTHTFIYRFYCHLKYIPHVAKEADLLWGV